MACIAVAQAAEGGSNVAEGAASLRSPIIPGRVAPAEGARESNPGGKNFSTKDAINQHSNPAKTWILNEIAALSDSRRASSFAALKR